MTIDFTKIDDISLVILLGLCGAGIFYFSTVGKAIYKELLKRGIDENYIQAALTVLSGIIPGASTVVG